MSWNYRITRERVTNPDGTEAYFFACREVYYDTDGKVTAWSKDPVDFAGDTPGDVAESLSRAAGCFGAGVLDLATRETVRLTLNGRPVKPRRSR